MATNFITNTASLKTTIADVRKLNVKKLVLGGENILDIIKKATPTIKHSQDTRETVTDDDLWGQWVETTSDGTIIVHDDWVTNPNASNYRSWNSSITKVENNKAYVGDALYGNIQTEKIKNGIHMFNYCENLESFNSDLSNLTNGTVMFQYCENLESFTSDLSSLTNGTMMFNYCENLESFSSDLSSLTTGGQMFNYCTNLKSFSSDLPSLTSGSYMFCDTKLTSFTSDLSSLTSSFNMFTDCTNLKSVFSDLSSLTDSDYMFYGCTALTSFTSDLSNLTTGKWMFSYCKLSAESVMYIADTIKDITAEKQLYVNGTIPYVTYDDTTYKYSAPRGFMSDGKYVYTYNVPQPNTPQPNTPQPNTTYISASNVGLLALCINVSNNSSTIKQQLEDFAKEATFDSWDVLKTYFSTKGWTVTFQYGGDSAVIPDEFPDTYGLRDGERIIPCPIFAKLVEAEKDSAQYCTEDASTFYNIEWGHDVTDTSSYTQFDSLEDAMASWNVFPKENIITTEE